MNPVEIEQFAEMIKRTYYKRRLWKSNEITITEMQLFGFINCIIFRGNFYLLNALNNIKEATPMKQIVLLTLIMCCLMLTGCNDTSIGVIGGADGPTAILVGENDGTVKGQFGEQLEKRTVRMFNVDGELYYDSGLVSDMTPRCGTLDGNLKKGVAENEIPHKSGEANFDVDGYQSVTSITKEINIDGKWVIFKKFDTYGRTIDGLKYCYYIKGHLSNAETDSEIIVLTEDEDTTFNDVYVPLLSSQSTDGEGVGKTIHNTISEDKWGLALYTDSVTKTGMTIRFEQFDGNPTGELQTGAWYKLETTVNDEWQDVKTNVDNAVWNSIAYGIKKNDITEFEVNWEFLYGEIAPGYYRLSKKIMDFRAAGDYDEEIYQVYFSIE